MSKLKKGQLVMSWGNVLDIANEVVTIDFLRSSPYYAEEILFPVPTEINLREELRSKMIDTLSGKFLTVDMAMQVIYQHYPVSEQQ